MAKPGDVMEFRSGHHGIEAPDNLGILLGRDRRKGVAWVRMWTVKGALELKADHLTKRAFKARYEGDLRDEGALAGRLRHFVQQHQGGGLAEEAEDDLGALEAALWESVADEGGEWTVEDLATRHYGEASPQQRKDVQAALERCRRPGVGRFETAQKGDVWRPWTRDEHARMVAAWQALADLRQRLVRRQDTDEGVVFERVEWRDAAVEDEATMVWVRAAMAQYIEHDGVPDKGIAGIGGLGAVQVFGMDLHRQLGFLAQDWIRSGHTSRSSDYLHFLLESGQWTPEDAVAALTRRHVNQEPFFEHVPDAAAEAAAMELADPAPERGRTDLRHLTCHTIDPPDAKDFDDAVGIEPMADGATRLWVHIADVSHYVRPGTHLDRHAKMRATSVYLPGRVLPMLPARIADHLCSLRSDGDRFALSAALTVDSGGRVTGATFTPSLIRVTENLAYGDALRRRDEGDEHFQALFDLAARMRRHRRGLALETGEIRVEVGEAFEATTKHGDDATQMIEVFMVAANEAVAKFLAEGDIPLLYRCHPMPEPDKARRFAGQLATMGLDIPFELPEKVRADEGRSLLDALQSGGKMQLFGGGMDLPEEPEEAEVQGFAALSPDEQDAWLRPFRDAVEALRSLGSARAEVATLKMLGCLGRAYYTPRNEGHFGLASTHYCHFTSPIRRYPDLVVHRNLKAMLAGESLPHAAEDLERLCDHCSDQERAAAALERRVKDACLVLASLHGEDAFATSQARVTGLTPGSLFVLLPTGIEARIGARDLPGGPYSVDEFESMLFVSDVEAPQRFDPEDLASLADWYDEELGERRKVRVRLGDAIQVRLAGRDVCEGRTGAEVVRWT